MMNLVKSNKKSFILFGAALAAATLVYALLLTGTELNVAAAHAFSANAELASTLGISTAAAKKQLILLMRHQQLLLSFLLSVSLQAQARFLMQSLQQQNND